MGGGTEAITVLRRLTQRREVREYCELCSVVLPEEHRHLFDASKGDIVCACDGCALTFQGVAGGRFKLIPRDSSWLLDFEMSGQAWQMLSLPIKLGFVFENSRSKNVTAIYPSPGGPTETIVSEESWSALTAKNPVLRSMQPDVEALLVNRVGEARDYFVAPIDVCYALVGLVRTQWRGLSGGDEVWVQLSAFFSRLKDRSAVVRTGSKPKEVVHA